MSTRILINPLVPGEHTHDCLCSYDEHDAVRWECQRSGCTFFRWEAR